MVPANRQRVYEIRGAIDVLRHFSRMFVTGANLEVPTWRLGHTRGQAPPNIDAW